MHAGEHTRLVNRFIGLCHDTLSWPNTLWQLGYEVQIIEQAISLESAVKIVPDVIAVSRKLSHAIVTDCKSGSSIKTEQDNRYTQLTSNNLAYHVTTHDSNLLSHIVCYVDNESNHVSLEPHTTLPFITFGQDMVRTKGDFGNQETNEKMQNPIPLTGMKEPTVYYPFSPNDEDHFVIPHVLTGLVSYLTKKRRPSARVQDLSTAGKILESIHPCYKEFSTKHKNDLVRKVRKMIHVSLASNSKFKEQILKIESGEYSIGTLQSLSGTCTEIVSDLQQQRRVDDF